MTVRSTVDILIYSVSVPTLIAGRYMRRRKMVMMMMEKEEKAEDLALAEA